MERKLPLSPVNRCLSPDGSSPGCFRRLDWSYFMKWPRRGVRLAAAMATCASAAMYAPALAASQPAAAGPAVVLMSAQNVITLPQIQGEVYLDPGVWVASLGSALQFDMQRASYTTPVTI